MAAGGGLQSKLVETISAAYRFGLTAVSTGSLRAAWAALLGIPVANIMKVDWRLASGGRRLLPESGQDVDVELLQVRELTENSAGSVETPSAANRTDGYIAPGESLTDYDLFFVAVVPDNQNGLEVVNALDGVTTRGSMANSAFAGAMADAGISVGLVAAVVAAPDVALATVAVNSATGQVVVVPPTLGPRVPTTTTTTPPIMCEITSLPAIRAGTWNCTEAVAVGQVCQVQCWSAAALRVASPVDALVEDMASVSAQCQSDRSFSYNNVTEFNQLYCATTYIDDEDSARSTIVVLGILAAALLIMCTTCGVCLYLRSRAQGGGEAPGKGDGSPQEGV